eukprot:s3080_g7.t1
MKWGRDKRGNDRGQGRGLSVQEIKLRTRCGICRQIGHWHRECPSKDDPKPEKEAHFLNQDIDFSGNSEVHFCGFLETDDIDATEDKFTDTTQINQIGTITEERDYPGRYYEIEKMEYTTSEHMEYQNRGASSSSTDRPLRDLRSFDLQLAQSSDWPVDSFDRPSSAAYMADPSELFFFENSLSKSARSSGGEVSEAACATLDTGCQRLAIGFDTLKEMLPFVPVPLKIKLVKSQNRFKSVHGISTTERVAVVPSSLGRRGSILRPAIFEDDHGKNVPFLLSLPLLMHSGCQISLEPNHGLFLQLGTGGERIRCHLGPAGSLRVPVMQFTDDKQSCLARDLAAINRDEFEILTTSVESISVVQPGASADDSSVNDRGAQPSVSKSPDHGELGEACSKPERLRCQRGLAQDPHQAAGFADADHAAHRALAEEGRFGDGRRVPDKPEHLEQSQCRSQSNTTSQGKSEDPQSLRKRDHLGDQSLHPRPAEEGADLRHPRPGNPDGRGTNLSLRSADQNLHGLHQWPEPRKGLLALPEGNREAMSLLRVAGVPTDDRPPRLEVHGGSGGSSTDPKGHLAADGAAPVQAHINDQAGEQPVRGEGHLQDLREGDSRDQEVSTCAQEDRQCRIKHGTQFDGAKSNRDGTVPTISPLATGSERVRRQVKQSLKKAIGFWKTIQELFSYHGVDDDTTTQKLRSLHDEIVSDLVMCPRGSKRVQQIAEAMHLTTKNLKTIAELYNPGCFSKFAKTHGLEPGIAFDLTLGYDLLCEKTRAHVREYVRTVRPGLVLIAPPCHMYSQLQNLLKELRQHDQEAMSRYLKKKKDANILLSFAVEIAEICRELGLIFVLEHPWSAESWQTKILKKLIQHEDVFVSRTDQCLFGLKGITGEPQRKRTGFATNHYDIAQVLNQHCTGQHKHEHIIGGSRSRQSQKYPDDLLHVILHTYSKSISRATYFLSSDDLLCEDRRFDQWFAQHLVPVTDEPTSEIYANELEEDWEDGENMEAVLPRVPDDVRSEGYEPSILDDSQEHPGAELLPGGDEHEEPQEHGHRHPLQPRRPQTLHALANDEVMKIARDFECAACARNKTVRPARRACPPREIQINEVVGADLVWLTTPNGTTRPALNLIDWHTHFQMMIPMKDKKPESVRQAYRHWIRFFGPPTTLALDMGREFEGSFALRAESDGTFVDPSSLESPYQRGITERAGKTFKLMLAKTMESYHCQSLFGIALPKRHYRAGWQNVQAHAGKDNGKLPLPIYGGMGRTR